MVSRVVGFKKIKFYTNENVGSGELDLPEQQMHTTSYWLTIPSAVMAALPYAADDRRDGVVGLSFALKQVAQLLLMCDGHDIGISINSGETGRESFPMDAARKRLRRPRYLRVRQLSRAASASARRCSRRTMSCSRATRRLIAECPCENGCPGCVGPIGNTGPLAKTAALQDPRSARRAGSEAPGLQAASEGRVLSDPRPLTKRSCRFELAGRSHPRDRGAGNVGSDKDPTHMGPMLGGPFWIRRPPPPISRPCSAARGAMAPSSSIGDGSRRRCTGASGSARWRSGSSDRPTRRRCSPAARRPGRRSCSSISRPPASAAAPARWRSWSAAAGSSATARS